ncbi:MAG: 7TM diverse intracellular signaling domain-containing protein [Leptospiraceae bacterium]|nr:7TM diverse intracellular signaling domain-containing protein [Leptospiraceae bacterium]
MSDILVRIYVIFFLSIIPISSEENPKKEIILINDIEDSFHLNPSLEIYKDTLGKESISTIIHPDFQNKFINHKIKSHNYGFDKSVFWIKIHIQSQITDSYILEVAFPILYDVRFYYQSNNEWKEEFSGTSYPFNKRALNARNPNFKLNLQKDKDEIIYLRVESGDSIQFPIFLFTKEGFSLKERNESFWFGIFFGILIVMFFYNLFIYFSVRDKSYLYYILYLFFIGLFCFSQLGLAFQYFWPNFSFFAKIINPILGTATIFTTSVFGRSFLATRKNNPKLDKFFSILQILSLMNILIIPFVPVDISGSILATISVIVILTIFAAAIIRVRENFTPAKYYLTAWLVLMFGAVAFSLKTLGILPSFFLTNYALQIGAISEATLLSLGLASRIDKLLIQESEWNTQLTIARNIQNSLLPQKIPDFIKNQFGFKYIPMMGVGGDFLDIQSNDKNQIGLFLCDVSGHGISAALLASMVKISLNSWLQNMESPLKILSNIKHSLTNKMSGHFLSAVVCFIDLNSGKMKYASAGHLPSLLLRKNGEFIWLKSKGVIIHESFPAKWEEIEVQLLEGDKLVIYTDGVTEAKDKNGVLYEEDRFLKLCLNNYNLSPKKFCEQVLNEIIKYTGTAELNDDFTVIVFEF